MIITRQKRNTPFVMIDKRPIECPGLSWKAKGILAYLLSKPDNWEVKEADIINHGKEGRDAVRSGIDELIKAGYMLKEQTRSEGGLFGANHYVVSDQPFTENPSTVNPLPDNPIHNNIEYNNKEENNIRKDTLSKKDQATNQFAKIYQPRLASYEMADAKEKISLFLSDASNMAYVIQDARTKKNPDEVMAYVNKFIQLSWDSKYRKYIQTFPELLRRFIDWLSRDREISKPVQVEGTIEDRKNAFILAISSKTPDKVIAKFKQLDVEAFKSHLEARILKSSTLSRMGELKTDDYIRISFKFGLRSTQKHFLMEILTRIENESWLQKYKHLYDAINKAAEDGK